MPDNRVDKRLAWMMAVASVFMGLVGIWSMILALRPSAYPSANQVEMEIRANIASIDAEIAQLPEFALERMELSAEKTRLFNRLRAKDYYVSMADSKKWDRLQSFLTGFIALVMAFVQVITIWLLKRTERDMRERLAEQEPIA